MHGKENAYHGKENAGQVPGEIERARQSVRKPNSEFPVASTRSGGRVVTLKRLGLN